MDAIDLLVADHQRMRGLFARFRDAHEAEDTAAMGELAEKIFEELKVHTTIEEECFYPGIREADEDLAETVYEGVEEHHVADVLRDESRELEPGDPVWVAKLTVLIENVEHHAEEEEEEMFPLVREKIDAELLQRWYTRMEQMKADLGAPTTADSEKLTTAELKRLASEQQIPGRSSMKRDELAAVVDPR